MDGARVRAPRCATSRLPSVCGALEQGIELAFAIEGDEVIEAADVPFSDEDLRHGAAARPLNHLHAPRRIRIDADLVDLLDTLGTQQPFGVDAVGAIAGRVHHDLPAHRLSTGRPALRQARIPPSST